MSGIFNLFGDSTQIAKPPTTFGSVGSVTNSALKLRNVGAPGATPGKIFGHKPKGLSIRSTSDLNVRSPAPQSSEVKKNDAQAEKSMLKPIDIFGKTPSSIKKKSPIKLKSPKKQIERLNPSQFILSPNSKIQFSEKSEQIVFKRPKTPLKPKKRDMDYPEPEVLAPIGDIDIELFDLNSGDFLKSCNNKLFFPEVDGFLSDTEPVPVVEAEIRSRESVSDVEKVPLPEVSPITDSDESSKEEFFKY